MKPICIASTKESMIRMLNEFWYTKNIVLIGEQLPYDVHNSKGKIEGVQVIKYKTGFKCINL